MDDRTEDILCWTTLMLSLVYVLYAVLLWGPLLVELVQQGNQL